MDQSNFNEEFAAYALKLVDFALHEYQIKLDYSEQSIPKIEEIAGAIYQERPKNIFQRFWKSELSQDEFDDLCTMLGSYLGEVYRRFHGGDWAINQEFETHGIRSGENWMFPISKVAKRLLNGPEDNLESFYLVFTDRSWSQNDG